MGVERAWLQADADVEAASGCNGVGFVGVEEVGASGDAGCGFEGEAGEELLGFGEEAFEVEVSGRVFEELQHQRDQRPDAV